MRDDRATPPSLNVLPGQVWLIEHDPDSALPALDRDALAQANVVLYDRALAPLVAEMLPLGSYAEPLPFGDATPSPRALDLAAEGWSVVQLVAARASRRAHLHSVPPRIAGAAARSHVRADAFTANGLAG